MEDTISLTMIVKNEAGNLKNCLDSVRGQVDEIVIVDTGSTDNTPEIARNYTDKVYSYPWEGDFSAARNFAIDKANGAWILTLDADEVLIPGTGDLKLLIAGENQIEAYLLPIDNPTAEATGEANRYWVLRFFKNNGHYRFCGKIHEQIVVSETGVVGIAKGPIIKHKMLSTRERNRKRGRNLALLKKACAEDSRNYFLQYYLGVEWLMLGKPDRALPFLKMAYHNLTDDNFIFRGPALRYLVICLIALGKYDEAICLCLEANLRYPEYTDIYYLGGVLFEEKKEYRLAVKWFNQALQCGTPPPLYNHMNGAGSFLACYHLGYCHEKLGQMELARRYYERALESNPSYIYPVYNLFGNLKAKHGPGHILEYFKEKGYLKLINISLTTAELFFALGYPGMARRCLEETKSKRTEEYTFSLGKYNIYSGRLQEGLEYLEMLPCESNFYIQACKLRTLAMLLMGRFKAGRGLALKLWKIPPARGYALVLIKLACLMEKGGELVYPPKVRGVELLDLSLEILNQCSCYLPDRYPNQQKDLFFRLFTGMEKIIKGISPRGYLALLEYYRAKANDVQSFMDYKFGRIGVQK